MTALPIKLKRTTIPLNAKLERRLILGLFALVIFLVISYLYFVTQTTINTVERENINDEMSDLGSYVSSLEVRYIELKNKINIILYNMICMIQ